MDLVRSIVCDPRLYDAMSDDHSPKAEDYQPPAEAVYVLVKTGERVRGLWVLVPRSHTRWEIHTVLLPDFRGIRALAAARLMAEWTWENTTCESLVTECPTCNPAALWFARMAGMVEYGQELKAFRKGNVLHDIKHLAMHRPEGVEIYPS